jgi:hypothetical protein
MLSNDCIKYNQSWLTWHPQSNHHWYSRHRQEGTRVLFIYHPFNIYNDGKGDIFQFGSGRLPSDIDYSFWNDTLWCLFDAKYKNEAELGLLPVGLCTFVVSTSPR